MLPTVVGNSYDFGYIDKSLFGHEVPIGCSVRIIMNKYNLKKNMS